MLPGTMWEQRRGLGGALHSRRGCDAGDHVPRPQRGSVGTELGWVTGLQPPTLCCVPTHETMPVTPGTAGQGDRNGSAPSLSQDPTAGGVFESLVPSRPHKTDGESRRLPRDGKCRSRGVGALVGGSVPCQPSLVGCPKKGTPGQPSHPPSLHG